jgi:hypothetical protein
MILFKERRYMTEETKIDAEWIEKQLSKIDWNEFWREVIDEISEEIDAYQNARVEVRAY